MFVTNMICSYKHKVFVISTPFTWILYQKLNSPRNSLLLLSTFMCKIHFCNWFDTKLQFSSHMTSSMYKHNMLHTKLSTEFDRFTLNIWKHQNVFRSMTSSFCRFLEMENTQNQNVYHETKNKKDDWEMNIIWRKRFFFFFVLLICNQL